MAILISINPEYVCKILNKEKTIEIRKSKPKCELPCKVYIYCTKGKDLWMHNKETIILGNTNLTSYYLNGKVVAEFTLNKVDCLRSEHYERYVTNYQYNEVSDKILTKSCLTQEQVLNYPNSNDLYVWYIDDLIIYDKPKELIEFSKHGFESLYGSSICGNSSCPFYLDSNSYDLPPECLCEKQCQIKKPPKSWCYVEEKGE